MKPRYKKIIKIAVPVVIVIAILFMLFGGSKGSNGMYVDEKAQVRSITTYHTFTGNIEAVNDVSIMPKMMGEVKAVYFKEGDEVKAGDVLAQFDDSTLRQNIALKEAALSNTELSNYYAIRDSRKAYEDYKASIENGENSTLNQAQAALDNARTMYETSKDTYERAKLELDNNIDASMIAATNQLNSVKLALDQAQKNYDDNEADIRGSEKGVANAEDAYESNPGADTRAALEAAKANLEALEARRESLESALDSARQSYNNQHNSYLSSYNTANTTLKRYYDDMMAKYDSYVQAQTNYNSASVSVQQTLENYSNTSEKTAATANTNVASIELDNLYSQLDDYQIIASIDGTLTDFDVKVGDTLSTAKPAAEITDYSTVQVAIKINEYDILGVENGVNVDINVEALNRDYKGVIKNVSKKAIVEKGVSYFTADVEFAADSYIRTGMSVEVKLKFRDAQNVVSVSMNALNYENNNTPYVLISNGKKIEKKYITVGVTDGSYIEVTDGLSEGDVVQAKSDAMIAMMNMYGSSGMSGGSSDSGESAR